MVHFIIASVLVLAAVTMVKLIGMHNEINRKAREVRFQNRK